MADVKIRKLEDWVVESFRTRAKASGHSLEEELRRLLTETARARRQDLIDEIDAFRQGLRDTYGEMADSTPVIREIRDRDLG